MVNKITKWHVLLPFIHGYGKHMILADLERELHAKHQTIKKYADKLVGAGILLEERKPKNVIYSLNRANPMALAYLSTAEKIFLEDVLEKNALLRRLYEVAVPSFDGKGILVFGSSASGKTGEDIDLLVAGSIEKGMAERFEHTYGRKLHVIETEAPSHALLVEVMKKHVIFSGFDFFTKMFWDATWKG